jgi:hypothetical protein
MKKGSIKKYTVMLIATIFITTSFIPVAGIGKESIISNDSLEKSENTADIIPDGFNPLPLGSDDPWWNTDWLYRKEITIDHTMVEGDLTNFPVLISFDSDEDLRDNAQDDGDDIVFVYADGTKLNHEIELYDSLTGELVSWVNVASLSGVVNTTFYMYYGNQHVSNQQNVESVWDNNYVMVQHLEETGDDILDSTINNNDGESFDTVFSEDGRIGGGRQYTGDEYITVDDFTHLPTTLTAEAWINRSTNLTANIFTKGTHFNESDWVLYLRPTHPGQEIDFGINNHTFGDYSRAGSTTQNVWFYITATYNAGDVVLYVNDTEVGSGTVNNSINNSFADLGLGNDNDGGQGWYGLLDELRISNIARDDSWINTSFNTMSDPSLFFNIGSEEMFVPEEPVVFNPNPANGSTEVDISLSNLSFNLTDFQGDDMDYSVATVPDIGDDSASGVGNRSYTLDFNDDLEYETVYTWYVNVTDPLGSGNWTRETFVFTTASFDSNPPVISNVFAGNPGDDGGPYFLPETDIPAVDGYYTNDSHQQESWIYINCSVDDFTSDVDEVWLHWLNESTWTNTSYPFIDLGDGLYEFNSSGIITNIASGYYYSFDIWTNDTLGNSDIYQWTKRGAYNNTGNRIYIQLAGTPVDVGYTPFYLYPADYSAGIVGHGYGSDPSPYNADVLHHDQGPDGTNHDTGYLLTEFPTDSIEEVWCAKYSGYWFDETVTAQEDTLRNIYFHNWWTLDADSFEFGLGKTRSGLYNNVGREEYFVADNSTAHSNITYNDRIYHLESRILDIEDPISYGDNDIYEFFINHYSNIYGVSPSLINNRSIMSFVIFNVPDNATLQSEDTDNDSLDDYTELFVTYTSPFINDTDNDKVSDFFEYISGSDPNNYTDMKDVDGPFIDNEYPTNESTGVSISLPMLSFNLTDYQSDLMNYSVETVPGIGTDSVSNVANGNYNVTVNVTLEFDTVYTWYVNVSDTGGHWTNETFYFTSRPENYYPMLINETPANGSTKIFTQPILSVNVTDLDEEPINITFRTNASDTWKDLGTYNGTNGRYTQQTSDMVDLDTTYYWSVHVTDGKVWTNATYQFTTTDSLNLPLKWYNETISGRTATGPLVADVTGDGDMEVIRSGATGVVVLDGDTGDEIWNYTYDMHNAHCPVEIIDLNKDNIPELIFSKDNGTIALHGNDGSLYWYNPVAPLYNKYCVAGDIDADGYPEVYVAVAGQITALTHDGQIFATTYTYYPCFSGLSLGDTNQDGVFELYLNERSEHFESHDGLGVRAMWASNLTDRWNRSDILCSSHCPTLVDVDKDGILDVVSLQQLGSDGAIVLNSTDGSVIHYTPNIPGMKCHSQPTIYDIDNDGNLEMIVCKGSKPIIWDLYNWQAEEAEGLDDLGRLPYVCKEPPAVADITGDGNVEIIACTDSNVTIFNNNYEIIGTLALSNAHAFVVAQDVDGDGYNNLVFNQQWFHSGGVYVFNTSGDTSNPKALSQFQFYSQHRGRSPDYESTGYLPYGPLTPIIKNAEPTDGSINQPLNPTLSAYIYDYQHNSMNITFRTNATGTWQDIDHHPNVQDGIYTAIPTTMNISDMTLYWSVNVTDIDGGNNWNNQTFSFSTEVDQGLWWNSSWEYRKMITIDHTLVDTDLYNFPVLISLDSDSDLANRALSNGDDIVFTDGGGNKLNHEIEHFNNVSGELIVWVNVINLFSTRDTILFMYYNNTNASNQQNPQGVWDDNYVMVQHLEETDDDILDSTINNNDGESFDTAFSEDGRIGGGRQYTGDDYITVNDFTHLPNTLTAEAWINRSTNLTANIFTKGTHFNESDWVLYLRPTHPGQEIDFGINNHTFGDYSRAGSTTQNVWFYITATYNSGDVFIYLNGIQIGNDSIGDSISNTFDDLGLGNDNDGGQGWYGLLDELRVSNVARDSSWIKTSFNTMNNPEMFFTIGQEEYINEESLYVNYSISLSQGWNLFSLPVNQSFQKENITIRYLGEGHTWESAVENHTIVDFVYDWYTNIQDYNTTNILNPGEGYWLYAYEACDLVISSKINSDGYITDVYPGWNLIGLPFNSSLAKENLYFYYDEMDHTWESAVENNTVLPFIYGWDESIQNYDFTDILYPERGYWIYVNEHCILKREI